MRIPIPRHRLLRWAVRTMASRDPDLVVGDRYMLRWHVLPRNRFFNVYLHRFLHDDEDEAMHDHPYASMSVVLDGGYFEHVLTARAPVWRPPGAVVLRRATTAHRIALADAGHYPDWTQPVHGPVYATSLFVTGPRVREWGFHCPKGWVPWHRFLDARDGYGSRKGCPP